MIRKAPRTLQAAEHYPQACFLPDRAMKISGTLLSMVLLTAYCISQVYATPNGVYTPDNCCLEFSNKKIPLKLLVSYKNTSRICSMEAVIFVTKGGHNICANTKDRWVQDVMKKLDNIKAKPMTPMMVLNTTSYPNVTSQQSRS